MPPYEICSRGGLCPPFPPPPLAGIWRCDTASSVVDVSSQQSSWNFRRSEYEPTRFPRNVGVLWHLRRVESSDNSLRKPKKWQLIFWSCWMWRRTYRNWRWMQYIIPKFWYQTTRLHGVITTDTTVSVFTALKISNYRHIYTGRLCIRNVMKKIYLISKGLWLPYSMLHLIPAHVSIWLTVYNSEQNKFRKS